MAGLALAGAGLLVYLIQSDRLDDHANAALEQEVAELEQRQRQGDPDTGRRYDSAVALMTATLRGNVPTEDELLAAYWGGRLQLQQAGDNDELTSDPDFRAVVDHLAGTGGTRDVDTAFGRIRVSVVPVQEGERAAGAMVFAYDTDRLRSQLHDLVWAYALVAGLALLVVAVGAFVVAGRLLSPVRNLRAAARDISESDLTRRITAVGNDDLTDLTETFNAMLDRLDEAFTTQRQFLDDVGHELKTPITIVRGHLELMHASNAADVESTRALVLDELDRMARLVEELILLAKSRRPGFLHRSETDVSELTDALVDKVRGLAARRWEVDGRAVGTAWVDRQRITQAALQLADNAVRHTTESHSIGLGTRIQDSTFELWVRDTGHGIPAELGEEIFDRFKRGSHVGEGSGLGLAIVRAIAEAHGGNVRVASSPGGGATFTITVPTGEG